MLLCCRAWAGIHCVPKSSCHDAGATDLVSVFLPHDHPPRFGQPGRLQYLLYTALLTLDIIHHLKHSRQATVLTLLCLTPT